MSTRIASWNVNSLNVRLPHVLQWLGETRADAPIDVLGIQETKLTDDKFPHAALLDAGWHSAWHGQKTYNGVCLISREPMTDITKGIPGFDDEQARVIAGTTAGGVRVIDAYVVNGKTVGDEKFDYKLRWLKALTDYVTDTLADHDQVAVVGDYNIAPTRDDTHDPDVWEGKILCSPQERGAFQTLLERGLTDAFTLFEPPEQRFTWWDYRAAGFRRNLGLRIDHLLLSDALKARCTGFEIDREPRTWERPSDHTPVVCTFNSP